MVTMATMSFTNFNNVVYTTLCVESDSVHFKFASVAYIFFYVESIVRHCYSGASNLLNFDGCHV